MVITREEMIDRIKNRLGDDTSDEAITLIEDVADTIDAYETRLADETDWKAKYEENDKSWREKYIARFNGKVESDADFIETPTAEDDQTDDIYEEPKTYEDLFTVKGED